MLKITIEARILIIFCLGLLSSPSRVDATAAEGPQCSPACGPESICVHTEPSRPAACKAIPAAAPLSDLRLPFKAGVKVICTHSSGSGSHSWSNAYFALDLASPYNDRPATVLASADGQAFVFQGADGKPCSQPPGHPAKAQTNSCGQSWGNHIKILHQGGYITFYVHLEHVLIKHGARVKKGQPIGIEGWTGAAGHRHLHWSVQKLPGNSQKEWEERITWDGESVPFKFTAIVDGKRQVIDSSQFKCAHAGIGAAPASQQPVLWNEP